MKNYSYLEIELCKTYEVLVQPVQIMTVTN